MRNTDASRSARHVAPVVAGLALSAAFVVACAPRATLRSDIVDGTLPDSAVDAAATSGDPASAGAAPRRSRVVELSNAHPDVARVEELLAGQVAGVQVFATPTGFAVRIRGTSSVMGRADPLYIVDGFPMEPDGFGLIALEPSSIARIEVLKDASSVAQYGVRGANGVVLITTKHGD